MSVSGTDSVSVSVWVTDSDSDSDTVPDTDTDRVAVAWGYVSGTEVAAGQQLLDRIAAMLYRLGARR